MKTPTLDALRTELRKPNIATAALATIVDQASGLATAAAERLATHATALDPLASAAERGKHRDSQVALRLDLEAAEAVSTEAARRYAMAIATDLERDRAAAYASAQTKADEAAAALRKSYPRVCHDALTLVRQLAEAQAAVNAVNAALPVGAAPLIDPELAVRGVPGAAREVVSDQEVVRWVRIDSDKPAEDLDIGDKASCIYAPAGPDGWGRRGGENSDAQAGYLRARFRRVEYREAVMPVQCLPLASYLRLPSIVGGGVLYGAYSEFGYDPAAAARAIGADDPERVVERLAALDLGAKQPDSSRPVRVEWQLLGYVGATPFEAADPQGYHARATEPLGQGRQFGASPFARPGRAAGGRR